MKTFLLCLTAIAVFTAVAFGETASEQTVRILQKTPTLSKEEMNQMLFTASFLEGNYVPGTIQLALYNPSREKSIQGIVINIHTKDANSGQEQSIDLFIDLSCYPLQCAERQEAFAVLKEIAKKSPVFSLKEVHYFIPEDVKAATFLKTDQARSAFITIQSNGVMEVDHVPLPLADLPAKLKELAGSHEKWQVIVKADKDVPYVRVVEVLDACRAAGITDVAFSSTTTPNVDK